MNEVNYEEQDYSGTFLTGFLIGLVMGAGITIWKAPRSGQATRQQIKDTIQGTATQVRERIQGETIEEAIEEGRAIAHTHKAEQARRVQRLSGRQ